MRYRRATMAGATYFFTVNLAERRAVSLTQHIDLLRGVIHRVKIAHPFHIDAMVVLPDHIHAMWTLPENDADYPMRWSLIKPGSRVGWAKLNASMKADNPNANVVSPEKGTSGNVVIGNISFAMIVTTPRMLITYTLIRLSMGT